MMPLLCGGDYSTHEVTYVGVMRITQLTRLLMLA